MTVLADYQVGVAAFQVGLRGETLALAIAVSFAEDSSHDTGDLAQVLAAAQRKLQPGSYPGLANWPNGSRNGGPEISVGLWQINSLAHPEYSAVLLTDPVTNALAMKAISNGGTNFSHWSTFEAGAHLQYLAQARQIAAAVSGPGAATKYVLPTVAELAATATSSTAGLPEVLSVLPPAQDDLLSAFQPAQSTTELLFPGAVIPLAEPDVSGRVVAGTADLTNDQISEFRFTILDPGLVLYDRLSDNGWPASVKVAAIASAQALTFPVVSWYGRRLLVASIEAGATQGVDSFTLVCRSLASQVFNLERQGVAGLGEVTDPTDTSNDTTTDNLGVKAALQAACATDPDNLPRTTNPLAPGWTAVIDPGLPSHQISRTPSDGLDPSSADTTWAVFQRASQEVGAWFFEIDEVFYLGRPSWLITQARQFKVGWNQGWGGDPTLRPLQMPDLRDATDEIPIVRYCRVILPRWRGEQVKPGYRLNLQGCGRRFDIAYIVVQVQYDVNDPNGPVTVDAQEPVDPYPTAADTSVSPTGAPFPSASATGTGTMQWPAGAKVTQEFGAGSPPHPGIDIGVFTGSPVKAADSGVVAASANGSAPPFQGYGNVVVIDHGNGTATLYGHLSERQVNKGDTVAKGQQIALSGATGFVTGPHLHFEVRKPKAGQDPTTPVSAGMIVVNPRTAINGDPSSVITTRPANISPDSPNGGHD